jgi:hypothetical protein
MWKEKRGKKMTLNLMQSLIGHPIQQLINKHIKISKNFEKCQGFGFPIQINFPLKKDMDFFYNAGNPILNNFIKYQLRFLKKTFGKEYYFCKPDIIYFPESESSEKLSLRIWIIKKEMLNKELKEINKKKNG